MKLSTYLFIFLIFPLTFQVGNSEPITALLLAAVGAGLYKYFSSPEVIHENVHKAYKYIGQKIGYFEGCEDYWITSNIRGLDYDLKENVFGQPIAVDMVLSALRHHLSSPPNKPLMLSFHGTPGTGKNYISQKILKYMFRNGVKTEYVHFFRGAIDFPSSSRLSLEKYKEHIAKKVQEMVYECHRSIIVFDEVDKMPPGLLEVLTAFVRTGQYKDFDFRRVIFILLSNLGETELLKYALDSVKRNTPREDMNSKHLSDMLAMTAFNSEGGLKKTGLIKGMGITHFVPFLPLERMHIIQCLEREVVNMQQIMSNNLTDGVLSELTYMPKPPDDLFVFGGCKGVGEKAAFLIERLISKQRRQNRGTLS